MKRRTHWSRKPEQIRRDKTFLKQVGLSFDKTDSGFCRLAISEAKARAVNLLIETRFEGVNGPEHRQAKNFWSDNFEELQGA